MSTTDREQTIISLDAWLGDARDDLTGEQYSRLVDEATSIADRYPDPDDEADMDDALEAALEYLLGETGPADVGADLTRVRIAARTAMVRAQEVARLAVQDGMSEVRAAETCQVDRMTVRKALGKR